MRSWCGLVLDALCKRSFNDFWMLTLARWQVSSKHLWNQQNANRKLMSTLVPVCLDYY